MAATAEEGFECSHCGDSVPAADAVMLTPKGDKSLWRYLCPDCLEEMGVPQGYVIDRDISFLRGGGSASTGADVEATSNERSVSNVIADFSGEIVTQEMPTDELRSGRILMNRRQLVLATLDRKTTIRLPSIHDADIRQMDDDASEYFNDVIALKYRHNGDDRMAFIAGTSDVIDRFSTVLYKALLSGTTVQLKHPAKVGGRVRRPDTRTGILKVHDGRLDIREMDAPMSIELDRVIQVEKRERSWAEGGLPVLAIGWEGTQSSVVEAELHLNSARRMSLLARYLRLRFGDRLRAIHGQELSDTERLVLISLFSGCSRSDLPDILGEGREATDKLIESLEEKGLLVTAEESSSLTREGMVQAYRSDDELF